MNKKLKTKGKTRSSSKYSEEVANQICDLIATGISIADVVKNNPKFPSSRTIFSWIRNKKSFADSYYVAKEAAADLYAEEILQIADEVMPLDQFGKIDTGAVNQARLRIDARKWIASKLKPKRYGDSTTIRGDSEAPLVPQVNLILNK